MDKCAPGKNFKDGSCFNKNELHIITKAVNSKSNPEDHIDINQSKKELVEDLSNKFKEEHGCDDQKCWIDQKVIKKTSNEDILKYTFRPDGPNGKTEWLSTTHINDVIEQYDNLVKDFKYLGTVPYDFEDLKELVIRDLDFRKLQDKGINKLGMVINLDYHYQSGSHWVALYTDLEKNQIYYFDSFAKKPRKKIKNFINRITKYLYKNKFNTKLDINKTLKSLEDGKISKEVENLSKLDIRYNNIQHQFKNSECGVYSINFIIRLAQGETFDHIINNITRDDEMNECRNVYFH